MTMRWARFKLRAIRAMFLCGLLILLPTGGGCIEAAGLLRSLTTPPTNANSNDNAANDNGMTPAENANDNAPDDVDNGNDNDNDNDNQNDNGDNANENSPDDDGIDAGPNPDNDNMNDNGDTPDDSENPEGIPPLPDGAILETSDTGVQTYDFVVGDGDMPEAGAMVRVAYTGYLERDGTIFDSNDSVVFDLDNLIAGFSEGVLGMRVGGMRRIIIPPDQGYGANGNPNAGIGGEDVIVFDVELLEIP